MSTKNSGTKSALEQLIKSPEDSNWFLIHLSEYRVLEKSYLRNVSNLENPDLKSILTSTTEEVTDFSHKVQYAIQQLLLMPQLNSIFKDQVRQVSNSDNLVIQEAIAKANSITNDNERLSQINAHIKAMKELKQGSFGKIINSIK